MAGSGKSHVINHLPLLFVDDPYTSCAMYRETNPMLEDGFWPNGRAIWENMPDSVPKEYHPKTIREQKKEIILKNGARIKYKQCADPRQAMKDAQGQEVTLYCLDEGTQLSWQFTEYLLSRLRSKSKYFSRIVISCNPDPDHEIRTMIDWYLTEDGYPDPEKDGKRRYFFREDGNYIWADSQEELGEKTGIPEDEWEDNFFSFSFVSGTIYDNPVMMKANPKYLASLKALNPVDRARLLDGNWDARPVGANYWQRDWITEITSDKVPSNTIACRAYDLAATERSQVNKSPDPTACARLEKDKFNNIYIKGDYIDEFYDDVLEVHGQFCKRSGDRDNHMLKQAEWDGTEVPIICPVDPGASGKSTFESMAKNFAQEGFMVKPDPTPTNKSKLIRFQPFATASENGYVYVVVDTFDKKTLEHIYKQLEAFNGERSTSTRHDEFPDLLATGFNYLMKSRVRRPMSAGSATETSLAQYKHHR